MRKLLAFVTVVTTTALPCLGFAGNDGPGCGLGTMIFKGQSGFLPHTLAATTNGTVSNQWFGLTSETSDCDPTSVVSNEYQREVFVASNMDHLSQEMAQGGGIHLETLAELLDISPQHQPDFYRLTQEHFQDLLGSSQEGAKAMLATLDSVLLADPILTHYVR